MANYILKSSVLRLVYDDGMTADNKPKRHSKSYIHIDPTSSADAMYQVAVQLGSLSAKELLSAEKQEVDEII